MTHYDDIQEISVADDPDALVLMHRDAHFSGSFASMLQYYHKPGKGVSPDIDISRIEDLAVKEKDAGENLAPLYLSQADMEKVARSREKYEALREDLSSKNKHKQLIAKLILSEADEATTELAAVIAEKAAIVPDLIELLKDETLYDPLFPGYGHAPALAASALGKIGDKRAIIALFEAIGEGDFFDEDHILKALELIGAPAKEFLLRVLKSHPLTPDNDRAAIALAAFKSDPEVAAEALSLLNDRAVLREIPFATYLILLCEGLSSLEEQQKLKELTAQEHFPAILKRDADLLLRQWQ